MESKYKGMTVNERLYHAGLIDSYYKAAQEKEVNEVIAILKKVDLDDASIDLNLELNGLKREK